MQNADRLCGYLCLDGDAFELPLSNTAGQSAVPITADLTLSASTPLLDLPALFLKRFFFFILTGNAITHVVRFEDVDNLPMHLCLFALCMELEAKLLELLRDSSDLGRLLRCLPPRRLEKAHALCELKYGCEEKPMPQNMLLCTTFIDKKTMLLRMPEILGRLPFDGTGQFDRAFSRIEQVRNEIAHGGSVLRVLPTPQRFNGFITDVQQTIMALSALVDER